MSDFTPKNYSGLTEAYASIYRKDETVNEEHLDQEIQTENVDCDPEVLVDVIVEHLVTNGYVKTENQALDMIPHIGDTWLDGILGNFVLEQSFINGVNSLLDEGCDLSSYTVDELYENYISNLVSENGLQDLHEVVPLLAAPLLANPAALAAGAGLAAGAVYAGKKALDAYKQKRGTGTDAASERWLKTGSYEAKPTAPTVYKAKISGDVDTSTTTRRERARERLRDRQSATPSPGSGGPFRPPGGGGGPKWKDILLGKTKAGLATRAGSTALGAADVYGSAKYGDPSWGLRALSVPTAAASLPVHLAGTLHRGVGDAARSMWDPLNVGKGTSPDIASKMWNQPWRKPTPAPAAPSGSGSQGMTPIFKNGQIVGYK